MVGNLKVLCCEWYSPHHVDVDRSEKTYRKILAKLGYIMEVYKLYQKEGGQSGSACYADYNLAFGE